MKNKGHIIWGIVLIVVGTLLGLKTTGIIDIDIFFDGWWTLFIIIPSFIGLFDDDDKLGNIIGILIGVALLLCCQDIISIELVFKLVFPIILVIVGVALLFRDVFNKRVMSNIKKINEDGPRKADNTCTFSSQRIVVSNEEYKGSTLTVIFGEIRLDLREAIIKEDVVINATNVFGGVDVLLPKDVKIKTVSTSIFGGVTDKRKDTDIKDKSKTVYINATSIFGGVDIK